jgi:hypothetical protein
MHITNTRIISQKSLRVLLTFVESLVAKAFLESLGCLVIKYIKKIKKKRKERVNKQRLKNKNAI